MGPRAAASLVALSFTALALAACGGAVATDLFAEGGDPDASVSPGPTTTSTSTGSVPTTPTVPPTTPTDPPPPPPPPPPIDAGRPDARDASTTVDAGGPGISCGGGLSCGLTETCCAVYVVPNYRFECRAGTNATCPSPSTDIHCDSSEDCPTSARICCGDKATGGYYNTLSCKSSCTGNDIVFCNPASPAASCRSGQTCKASTILNGLSYCD